MGFHTLGPSSLPIVVAQPDEIYANSTASVFKVIYRHIEHITSGSNEEQHKDEDIFFGHINLPSETF